MTDDRPTHRHPLSLPARKLRRLALEHLFQLQDSGDLANAPLDLRGGDLRPTQRVADVLRHRHVGVEGVALEDHRHVAILRLQVRHVAIADRDGTVGDLLQAGDHPQQRRLPAPRRTDEYEQLTIGDVEIDLVDGAPSSCRTSSSRRAQRCQPFGILSIEGVSTSDFLASSAATASPLRARRRASRRWRQASLPSGSDSVLGRPTHVDQDDVRAHREH